MGLSLVGVMIMAGSLNLTEIVRAQQHYPVGMFAIPQFIGFLCLYPGGLCRDEQAAL